MKPEVQSWYDAYKDKSRPEILEFQRRWTENAPQYKACAVILDEMEERRYQETLASTRSSGRSTHWGLIAGIVGVFLTAIGIYITWPSQSPPPKDQIQIPPSTSPLLTTPLPGATSTVTPPIPTEPAHKPDEKPKALPTPPKE